MLEEEIHVCPVKYQQGIIFYKIPQNVRFNDILKSVTHFEGGANKYALNCAFSVPILPLDDNH